MTRSRSRAFVLGLALAASACGADDGGLSVERIEEALESDETNAFDFVESHPDLFASTADLDDVITPSADFEDEIANLESVMQIASDPNVVVIRVLMAAQLVEDLPWDFSATVDAGALLIRRIPVGAESVIAARSDETTFEINVPAGGPAFTGPSSDLLGFEWLSITDGTSNTLAFQVNGQPAVTITTDDLASLPGPFFVEDETSSLAFAVSDGATDSSFFFGLQTLLSDDSSFGEFRAVAQASDRDISGVFGVRRSDQSPRFIARLTDDGFTLSAVALGTISSGELAGQVRTRDFTAGVVGGTFSARTGTFIGVFEPTDN